MTVATLTLTEARLRLAWRAAPATAAFVLGVEAASRAARDIVDGLLLAAIQSANVSLISADPGLQVTYGAMGQSPPTELRRPVSISAVANSLRMPFETVRRRVQILVRLGALDVTPKGVLLSKLALMHPDLLADGMDRHERLRTFYLDMKGLGILPLEGPSAGPIPRWTDPPVRITNRLIWDYILRIADAFGALVGDATNGVILLAMIRANTDGFAPTSLAAWARDPLAVAIPVRNRRLAEEVNFSSETLRRYVIALEARGLCQRGRNGLVALAPDTMRRALDGLVLENLANLQRLFARLRQYGVLAEWDAPGVTAARG